jgi:Pectate lyase superfamily protein
MAGFVDVIAYGAVGDGSTDDYAAIIATIRAVDAAGGGTVFFPAGTYQISESLANGAAGFSKIHLLGDGDRAATIRVSSNCAPISGSWYLCRIENLVIDANSQGSAGLTVDLDKSYVRHCWVQGWSNYGMQLNPTAVGLLNWIDDNFIEQGTGYGVYTTYRFYDSWIVNNNIGSTGPNVSVESGPVRIVANHLNGTPQNNIELRGNKSINIFGNLCEGSRRAIVYTMPPWLDTDTPQVQIVGNNITNGGKGAPNEYPAIGIYSRDATHRTRGFNITGNLFACEDDGAGWSYAIDAEHVDDLAIAGNQWENNGFSATAVRASGRNVSLAGNTSGNRTSRVVRTVSGATTLGSAANTDYVYFVSSGATATLPTAVGNANRYTVKNIGTAETTLDTTAGETIDGHTALTLTPNTPVNVISDGVNWRRI